MFFKNMKVLYLLLPPREDTSKKKGRKYVSKNIAHAIYWFLGNNYKLIS